MNATSYWNSLPFGVQGSYRSGKIIRQQYLVNLICFVRGHAEDSVLLLLVRISWSVQFSCVEFRPSYAWSPQELTPDIEILLTTTTLISCRIKWFMSYTSMSLTKRPNEKTTKVVIKGYRSHKRH